MKGVHKRKQPKQIKTQKKQKTKNDTNATTLSSNITQEINIEYDTSIGQSNINNIQWHNNIDTSSSTTNAHNFQQEYYMGISNSPQSKTLQLYWRNF